MKIGEPEENRPTQLTQGQPVGGTTQPFEDEAQTALFKDPVRTAQ